MTTTKQQLSDCQEENLRLYTENAQLQGELAKLKECYADRDGDLQFEFDRANAAEKEVERLRSELAACREREQKDNAIIEVLKAECGSNLARAQRLDAEVERLNTESRQWQEYGMARNEQLVECRARLESKSLGVELRNRGIDNLTGQIVQQQEAIGQLSAALKHYRTSDNWIHIPDDRGNMYWAWDGDGKPWQVAALALAAAGVHDAPATEREQEAQPGGEVAGQAQETDNGWA